MWESIWACGAIVARTRPSLRFIGPMTTPSYICFVLPYAIFPTSSFHSFTTRLHPPTHSLKTFESWEHLISDHGHEKEYKPEEFLRREKGRFHASCLSTAYILIHKVIYWRVSDFYGLNTVGIARRAPRLEDEGGYTYLQITTTTTKLETRRKNTSERRLAVLKRNLPHPVSTFVQGGRRRKHQWAYGK